MKIHLGSLVVANVLFCLLLMSNLRRHEIHGLRCLHANIHASEDHQRRILEVSKTSYKFHVIAFLDPYHRTQEKLTSVACYQLAHVSKTKISFAIYVRKDIGLDAYRPVDVICECEGEDRTRHENEMGTLAFRLKGDRILNVTALYNRDASLLPGCFESLFGLSGLHIIGGDWNIHFLGRPPEPIARALAATFEYYGLHNLNNKDENTFHKQVKGVPHDSIIDYTWCSKELLSPRLPRWERCPNPLIKTSTMDHDAIFSEYYGFTITWKERVLPSPAAVNENTFPHKVEKALMGLMDIISSGASDIHEVTEMFLQRIQTTINQNVPHMKKSFFKPSKFRTADTPEMASVRQVLKSKTELCNAEEKKARTLLSFININVSCSAVEIKRAVWQSFNQLKVELGSLTERLSKLEAHAFKVKWREEQYRTEQTIDRYARWAARRPKPLPHIPDLFVAIDDSPDAPIRRISDDRDKARAFHHSWQPPEPDNSEEQAGTDDNIDSNIPVHRFEMPQEVTADRVMRAVKKQHTRSTPGDDEIAPWCIKLCIDVLLKYLIVIFTFCCHHSVFPSAFKKARIIPITKVPGTNTHDMDDYRPISLLSSLGKLLESYLADIMAEATMLYDLLPKTQMAFRGRGTSAALLHATEIIRAARRVNLVVSILAMDVTGAFNRVYRRKLLRILRKKGFDEWFVRMIDDWLSGRQACIVLPGYISDFWPLEDGVPQGSPLSALLYAFFACGLLEDPDDVDGECMIKIKEKDSNGEEHVVGLVFKLAFMDDTYYLAVSDSLARNVDILEAEYKKAQKWASQFQQHFKPKKIHAFHVCPLAERVQGPRLGDRIPNFLPANETNTLKMLGIRLQVDDKGNLIWDAHLADLQEKSKGIVAAFRRLVRSTNGYGPVEAAKYYTERIRPSYTYGCGAYITPEDTYSPETDKSNHGHCTSGRKQPSGKRTKEPPKPADEQSRAKVLGELTKLQNQCLRIITGAMQRSSTMSSLEETGLESMQIFVDRTSLKQRANIILSEVGTTIDKARNEVEEFGIQVQIRRERYRPCAPRIQWVDTIRARRMDRKEVKLAIKAYRKVMSTAGAVWTTASRERAKQYITKYCRKASAKKMQSLWRSYRKEAIKELEAKGSPVPKYLNGSWAKTNLSLYAKMRPPLSTLLFQLRTEKIGLMAHLTTLKGKDNRTEDDELCRLCERAPETVQHLFRDCTKLRDVQKILDEKIGGDWDNLLTTHRYYAATFALLYFPITTFDWSRQNMLKAYLGVSPMD